MKPFTEAALIVGTVMALYAGLNAAIMLTAGFPEGWLYYTQAAHYSAPH
jgi:hypothetical protein